MSELKQGNPIVNFNVTNQKEVNAASGLLPRVKGSTNREVNNQMGNKIRELRKEHKLTQTGLSKQLGVTSTYITLIEQGKRNGADEFLFKVEKFFKLKPKTLLKLRDVENSESIQEQEQESEQKPITDHPPDTIQLLVDTLLSCGEDYVDQKVPLWLKELQDDLFNRLTPYNLEQVKKYVIDVKTSWIDAIKANEVFKEDSDNIQGYIIEDEKKHFFSLQLDSCALTLSLLHEDSQNGQYFENLLGTCSIRYSNPQQLPFLNKDEKTTNYLWFSPHVSISDIYSYLKKFDIDINHMEINEARLNWYFHELNIEIGEA